MTLIAGLRAVTVVVLFIMFIVHFALTVFMAVDTGKATGIATGMTVRTGEVVIAGQRKRMLEARRCPRCRCMAIRAVMRKAERRMILSPLIIVTVAAITIR